MPIIRLNGQELLLGLALFIAPGFALGQESASDPQQGIELVRVALTYGLRGAADVGETVLLRDEDARAVV